MSIGLVGKKVGMTRVFTEAGASVPVTVVYVPANRVTRRRTNESDGYEALQVTFGEKKASRINKPSSGHYAANGVTAGRGLKEFRVSSDVLEKFTVGSELNANLFSVGQKVSVTGVSKGKGFAGPVKRHNFGMQDATHGNSISHRAHGSTGQCQDPGRVFKGKKMAGQMGNVQVTTKNLEVVQIDTDNELLLIKGSIPGAPGGDIMVRLVNETEFNVPAEEIVEKSEQVPEITQEASQEEISQESRKDTPEESASETESAEENS